MSFAVRVANDGRLSFVGNSNAASPTLGVNLSTAAGQGLTAGVWTWVLFSLDFAAGAASVWFNDTAKRSAPFPVRAPWAASYISPIRRRSSRRRGLRSNWTTD